MIALNMWYGHILAGYMYTVNRKAICFLGLFSKSATHV